MIDTHAHLDDERFEGEREAVIQRFIDEGGKMIINPAADYQSAKEAVLLSQKYDIVYATVGVHPHDAKSLTDEIYNYIEEKGLNEEKVIGIGEIGLDYHYDHSPREVQKEGFDRQLSIASSLDLPVVIHSREAHQDTYDMLLKYKGRLKGVMHSYSGSPEMAKQYLDLGFYISFSGPITFKNARKLPEVAKMVPYDRILTETDSPYLTPTPFRGKRNEPSYVKFVTNKVAEYKEASPEKINEWVEKNVKQLFFPREDIKL